ncbi:MAG: hypothetical protein ABR591_11425 [Candidatus Velthaea sp.]
MGDTIEALGYKADVPSRVKENVADRVETVKGTVSDVVDNVKSAVTGAGSRVGEALGATRRTGTDLLSDTKDRLGDTKDRLADTVSNVSVPDVGGGARRAVGIATENPLGLALGALALGFIGGLLMPVTDIERERIGPLRDKLVDQAQAAGSDLMDAGKQVLQETAQAVVSSAQQHGKDVVDAAKTRASGDEDAGSGQMSGDLSNRPGMPGTAAP